MSCDKLMIAALKGIDFRYKMDDIIDELPSKEKFSSKQLEGYLTKRGVSPKEIQANSLFNQVSPNEVYTAKEWQVLNEVEGRQRLTQRGVYEGYEEISLGGKGQTSTRYEETGDIIQQRLRENVPTPHYQEALEVVENDPFASEYIMGHRRVHLDTINDKPTTVLNEFQSDWAQAERSGRGSFKSSKGSNYLDEIRSKYNLTESDGTNALLNAVTADEFDKVKPIIDNLSRGIIADFPMSPIKYQQYQIVKTIDEAIKNGTNRVAIPIEREGELMGSAGVTKFYENLNKKILPDIRKKLDKQGLKINLTKERYEVGKNLPEKVDFALSDNVHEHKAEEFFDDLEDALGQVNLEIGDFHEEGFDWGEITDMVKGTKVEKYVNDIGETLVRGLENRLHIIEIEQIPNKPVRWDIYSVLGAIGLSDVANELNGDTK